MILDELYPNRPAARERFAERFWSKVDVQAEDECWPWLGATEPYRSSNVPGGYGRFGIDGKKWRAAHRVSYMLANGEVPDDLAVCHTCDNPPCCNPRHLWLGTRVDNNRDRDQKGRARNGASPGSRNGRAKLVEADVATIRLRAADGVPYDVLAGEYAVTTTSIRFIVQRKTWRHVKVGAA